MLAKTDTPATGSTLARGAGWSEDPLTARARSVWTSGDFQPIAQAYAPGAAKFVKRLALTHGESVLDVACGTGNLTIPAAQAGAQVTGVDIAPNLLALARAEARAAGVAIAFDIGDVESLAFADGTFDTTISMFGAMFAYRPERAAAEMLRVTRRGGRVAMANWMPSGVIADLLRAHVAIVPPPAGVPSTLEWGKPDVVRARFGAGARSVECTPRTIELTFPFPPQAVTELFATNYGPTAATLRATDPDGAARLRQDVTAVFTKHNRATDGSTLLVGEYLDVQVRVA